MFSCKFFEIFKNTFFTEHLRVTASGFSFVWVERVPFYLLPGVGSKDGQCIYVILYDLIVILNK